MVMADRKGRDGMLIVNNEDPVNGKYCQTERQFFCTRVNTHLWTYSFLHVFNYFILVSDDVH